MSKDANNVPALRFKGFSDAWEKRKLGDLGQVAMNKRIYKDQTSSTGDVPFYKIGTFGKEADSFISRELFEKYKKMYPFPEAGDILISASGSIGRKLVYDGEDAYFQDSNIIWIKHDERLANSFLNQFLSIVHWNGTEGTTIKRLYNKNVLTTKINIPSRKEQDTIGSCLTIFDNLIAATQGKLDQLEMVKKALLQHLFDQSMRFKGYSDPWEKRKLGDVTKLITKGTTPRKQNGQGTINFIKVENISKGGNISVTNKISFEEHQGYLARSVLQENDILFSIAGSLGRTAIISKSLLPANTNQALAIIRLGSGDVKFVATYLSGTAVNEYIKRNPTTGAQPNISLTQVASLHIDWPCLDEQRTIAKLFSKVNNLIAATQSKLSGLESLKKALLQGLFI